ncbi:asparagine amidohydrolase [Pandoraea terrae]|uniref:Asparagine amidohydrolase n=1 Tax=Pandoraea terrae TaxID=1537710 RepID=A0A5E4YEM4_9BURK|nr:asparaginase [Pandoraea terrae]VVE46950.1 asparagine amidohydrolase [Pandoraea terrae]
MTLAPLVEVTRGAGSVDTVECIHYGSVAVVDAAGRLRYAAGDPSFLTFSRSTLKPFQALPFVEGGGVSHFDLTSAELALLCASHSGEAFHLDGVRSLLTKSGCDEHHLQCGCHTPTYYSAVGKRPPANLKPTPLHHNCSGKHAGFLAYCAQYGLPLESYLDPAHPLQMAIRKRVGSVVGMDGNDLPLGIDGCSAPNYALPLERLAAAYARLAASEGDALSTLFAAMTAHPEMVSGTNRNDLAFMRMAPGDWVAKIGADGVQTIGIRSAGLGIAIKVVDGNMRALYTAAVSVLQQLGYVDAPENTGLAPWALPLVTNARGTRTGVVRPVVKLKRV